MLGGEGLFRPTEKGHALLEVPCRFDGKQRPKLDQAGQEKVGQVLAAIQETCKMNSSELEAKVKSKLFELHVCCWFKALSQVTHVFVFLAFLSPVENVFLPVSSRCLLSTRPTLTLTTTSLALTQPFIFWLLSGDNRDTSYDGHANCQLFSQLLC